MAQSNLSINEKRKVRERIELYVGSIRNVDRRHKYWFLTEDNKTLFFVTFSNIDDLFYDVNPDDLDNWLQYPQAYAIFVIGQHTDVLIIPVKRLQKLIIHLKPKGHGDIKLHIIVTQNGYEFREVPQIDLSEYYNNFLQLNSDGKIIEMNVDADLDALIFEEEYFDGKKGYRWTSFYERNPQLRSTAIIEHGTKCKACDIDFEAKYGERGEGFIEVHHLIPVNTLAEEVLVDPVNDMTVVCSNCHRMIHRRKNEILSISELKAIIRKAQANPS